MLLCYAEAAAMCELVIVRAVVAICEVVIVRAVVAMCAVIACAVNTRAAQLNLEVLTQCENRGQSRNKQTCSQQISRSQPNIVPSEEVREGE